ncbi:MAG TPA: tetratricopeptide repeat protein [Acidobacteriaceae bacterium]|nr:tetratricopeptide repeat protein [Acidobacteriaceae bacterium]
MESRKSTYLSIGLPLLLALFYVVAVHRPWAVTSPSHEPSSVQESSQLWEECNSLYRAGKYQQALPGVLKLHQLYPGNHIYIEMAAEIYDHLGRYDQEANFWEEYFDRAPNPVTACPQIGQAYWKQGKQKEALSAFERCLARDPENSDSIFFLAHALELSGQTDRAAELYQRGINISPGYDDLQLGLARIYLRRGKDIEARQIAMKVLAKSPRNSDALLVAGLSYARESDPAKAMQYLQEGEKLTDGESDFELAIARLDEREKDFSGAVFEYNKILQAKPDNAEIRSKRDALLEKH